MHTLVQTSCLTECHDDQIEITSADKTLRLRLTKRGFRLRILGVHNPLRAPTGQILGVHVHPLHPRFLRLCSWMLFELKNADTEWLDKPPEEWERHESYLQCKAFVNSVKVVNDTAERGIAMLKSFAQCVKGQQQFQWLLQAVEQHRRKIPRLTKQALSNV